MERDQSLEYDAILLEIEDKKQEGNEHDSRILRRNQPSMHVRRIEPERKRGARGLARLRKQANRRKLLIKNSFHHARDEGQGKSDHVEVAPFNARNPPCRPPLDGISSGLVHRLAPLNVAGNLLLG